MSDAIEIEAEPICHILTLNGGSSSIRFAVYEESEPLRRRFGGKVDRIGLSGTRLTFRDSTGKRQDRLTIDMDVMRRRAFAAMVFTVCLMNSSWRNSRRGDAAATKGRVILAHLGNGASLAAVRDGKSIDTSMGFTPTAGSVMSSRVLGFGTRKNT